MTRLFLFIFLATSLTISSQNSIAKKQMKAMTKFENNADSFGKRTTTNINTKLAIDRSSKQIFFTSKVRQSKYVIDGRTFYNMTTHVNFYLKDVQRVYEVGNTIRFDLRNKGFVMRAKAPRENWSRAKRLRMYFNMTVYNSKLRKETLRDLKFLVQNPKFRLN